MFPDSSSTSPYREGSGYPKELYSPNGVLHRCMGTSPFHNDDVWYTPVGQTAHYGLTYTQAIKTGFTTKQILGK